MDRLLTPQELAERYHHPSTVTLRDWRYKRTGPKWIKVGKRVFYRECDIAAWEAKQVAA